MESDTNFLIDIVVKAGDMCKEKYSTQNKGAESDLVTTLDFKIEKFIIDELKKKYPGFDIVSEEFNSNNEVRKKQLYHRSNRWNNKFCK